MGGGGNGRRETTIDKSRKETAYRVARYETDVTLTRLLRRPIVFKPTYELFQFRIIVFVGNFSHHILQENICM